MRLRKLGSWSYRTDAVASAHQPFHFDIVRSCTPRASSTALPPVTIKSLAAFRALWADGDLPDEASHLTTEDLDAIITQVEFELITLHVGKCPCGDLLPTPTEPNIAVRQAAQKARYDGPI
jgi:hypothetical protein